MQRSKQQALMFLLGAVLVGGVLGLSAERVLGHTDPGGQWIGREKMYDDLGLAPPQRAAMDSVLDDRNRRVDSLLGPIKLQIDSIRYNARAQFYHIFTPEQRAKFDARLREDSLRKEQARKDRENKKK
jgi:Spy/CpxP family protein refolding chaperone